MLAATPPNHWLGLLVLVIACEAAAAGCPHPSESTRATEGTLLASLLAASPPPPPPPPPNVD